jgi:hypothetical protein
MCTSKIVLDVLRQEFCAFANNNMLPTTNMRQLISGEVLFYKTFNMLSKNRMLVNIFFLRQKNGMKSWTFSIKNRLIQHFIIDLTIEKNELPIHYEWLGVGKDKYLESFTIESTLHNVDIDNDDNFYSTSMAINIKYIRTIS